VYPLAQSPPWTGGNPRISPDSSGVIVVLLVEGVVWYAVVRSARSVVGLFREAQRWRVVLVLVDLPVLAFFFFFFFSVGSFGLGCAAAPACLLYRGCYINIAGRKPISRRIN
jgi:hypothetical protein